MDKELYDLWEVEAPQKHKELSEFVYAIKMHTEEFPRFETLSFDLWGMGYEAIPRNEKADEHLKERLKIIHLCLGGAYLQ